MSYEIIDSAELAKRWSVPESWVRCYTGQRVSREHRIPCIRLGRYIRFEWGSPSLEEWLNSRRTGHETKLGSRNIPILSHLSKSPNSL